MTWQSRFRFGLISPPLSLIEAQGDVYWHRPVAPKVVVHGGDVDREAVAGVPIPELRIRSNTGATK